MNEKSPTLDFEALPAQLAEPGFFENGIAEIERPRSHLGDARTDRLLNGFRQLME